MVFQLNLKKIKKNIKFRLKITLKVKIINKHVSACVCAQQKRSYYKNACFTHTYTHTSAAFRLLFKHQILLCLFFFLLENIINCNRSIFKESTYIAAIAFINNNFK